MAYLSRHYDALLVGYTLFDVGLCGTIEQVDAYEWTAQRLKCYLVAAMQHFALQRVSRQPAVVADAFSRLLFRKFNRLPAAASSIVLSNL